jgi:hypothetical protein
MERGNSEVVSSQSSAGRGELWHLGPDEAALMESETEAACAAAVPTSHRPTSLPQTFSDLERRPS